ARCTRLPFRALRHPARQRRWLLSGVERPCAAWKLRRGKRYADLQIDHGVVPQMRGGVRRAEQNPDVYLASVDKLMLCDTRLTRLQAGLLAAAHAGIAHDSRS